MKFIAPLLYLFHILPLITVVVSENGYGCVHIKSRKEVNCRGLGLKNIPYDYLRNKSFNKLDLGLNKITHLDTDEFSNLLGRDQIETLYLDHNQIAHVPHNLDKVLPNLKNLDFSHNSLNHMPRVFCHMTKLEVVSVCGNRIETNSKIPRCLKNKDVYGNNCILIKVYDDPINENNAERPTLPASTEVKPSLTTRQSPTKHDKPPVEEERKNEKASAVSVLANMYIVVVFVWVSFQLHVFFLITLT